MTKKIKMKNNKIKENKIIRIYLNERTGTLCFETKKLTKQQYKIYNEHNI